MKSIRTQILSRMQVVESKGDTQVLSYYSGTSGFYCQMFPTSKSCARIVETLRSIVDGTAYMEVGPKLHCTIIYSPEVSLPVQSLPWVNRDVRILAQATGYNYFKSDEKETGAVVLELSSDELQAYHKSLLALGLRHSFPDFKPHITLYPDVIPEVASNLIRQLEQSNMPKQVVLTAPVFEDIKPD